jgi:DNA-binding NarL/FixJ family response regulator
MSEFHMDVGSGTEDLRFFVDVAIGSGALEVLGVASNHDQTVELAHVHQPDVMVLDLDAMGAGREVVAAVRQVAPNTRVVVVSDSQPDRTREVLGVNPDGYVSRKVSAHRLVEEILHLVSGALAQAAAALESSPDSARSARQLASAAVSAWGRQEVEDAVTLLISELVTNAVRHARSVVEVVIRLLPERVRVEVRDNSPDPPQPREADAEDESGRGLILVDALAHAWGVEAREDGKSVWFEVLLS